MRAGSTIFTRPDVCAKFGEILSMFRRSNLGGKIMIIKSSRSEINTIIIALQTCNLNSFKTFTFLYYIFLNLILSNSAHAFSADLDQ